MHRRSERNVALTSTRAVLSLVLVGSGLLAIPGVVEARTGVVKTALPMPASAVTGTLAYDDNGQPAYDPDMLAVLAETMGTSPEEAAQTLAEQSRQTQQLDEVAHSGVRPDGTFFDTDGSLVVNVTNDDEARAVRAQGLKPRRNARGDSQLRAVSAQIRSVLAMDDAANMSVLSYSPDLRTGTVNVTAKPGQVAQAKAAVEGLDYVTVTEAPADEYVPHADVIGGQIMKMMGGGNCSLAYPGVTNQGQRVMLTAGHCIEGNPTIADRNGQTIGQGTNGRFRKGAPSMDMGLMVMAQGAVGQPYIDMRTGNTMRTYGMSAAPVGSPICKAGNTTGWTCGYVMSYNNSVNYGGTQVSGLAQASVCTQPGDSGGAYMSAGGMAQGMTSGGPSNSNCGGFNQGYNARSTSFYQPVTDAAQYYGVTLTTVYTGPR